MASQVLPTAAPATAQSSLRDMAGELTSWNPDLGWFEAYRMLQNCYRRIIDSRSWYGFCVKGQLTVPSAYTTGTVAVTRDSTTVIGTGTVFTSAMVGRQFRVGFSNPINTIKTFNSVTSIDLDIPWGGSTQAGVGFQIFQNIVSFGNNVKMILEVVNQRQGYRLQLHMPQEVLNLKDTWRTSTGWTRAVADYAPSPTGEPQYELWPAPTFEQAFPFLVYIQPADLTDDDDKPVLWIRSDVIVLGALPDALLFRGKASRFYDPQTAAYKRKEFAIELQKMMDNDDNSLMQNLKWNYSRYPIVDLGGSFWQAHDQDSMFA